MLVQPFDH
jgi:hypothetical protein